MTSDNLNWIANFIWGIADDVLRDVYVRGKYRDVILPMVVIRRLDALLEGTKPAVLAMKQRLDAANITSQAPALRQAAGQAFYNASPFTLRDLASRGKAQQLRDDFIAYLDGFSPNVQEILEKFRFRNQIPTLVDADILGHLITKFLDRSINLSPKPVLDEEGAVRLPGLDNHGMSTVFEELLRRFNEENNEEAGEHFTPRDAVQLMAALLFEPVAGQVQSTTYLLYDDACGTGGMLTVGEATLLEIARAVGKEVVIHLYGQEVNPETYAITKADLLLKGEGEEAENFRLGSTLSQDGFLAQRFDFMLANAPYGKSWKTDLDRLGGKGEITDPRFVINYAGDPAYSLITRSSDGQLMFLANKLAKMKHDTPLGSRIVAVHNGSSLFTGDAGQGESNLRRWIIENDWLEAIIALPLNMFYNTGIATYIWVISNRKPAARQGKVQLIDASNWFRPLRKNLGKKNCELGPEEQRRILDTFLAFKETPESKIFPNQAFGYSKITVLRPLRLRVDFAPAALKALATACKEADEEPLAHVADRVARRLGPGPHLDFNHVWAAVVDDADERDVKLTAKRERLFRDHLCRRDESAAPVIATRHKPGKANPDPLHGLYSLSASGGEVALAGGTSAAGPRPRERERVAGGRVRDEGAKPNQSARVTQQDLIVEFEPDPELTDTEQVPLLEPGGIEAFFRREVLPHVPDAWIDAEATKIGYEISFTRYFYQPQALRTLADIRREIESLEKETEGLLGEVLVDAPAKP